MTSCLILSSCTYETEPQAGPDGSWWLGGADGGVFILVNEDAINSDRIYNGSIYYEGSFKPWYRGKMELVGEIDFEPNNKEQYLFWDGELLDLDQQSYLKPLDEITPP